MIESLQKQLEMHLDTLEVDSSHSWDDIEKQYRQLIQRWHPDRNLGENCELAQTKFIEINSAYKAVREQYRKNGSIPRRMPPEQEGPLLGTKKEIVVKPTFYTNKIIIATLLGIVLLTVFAAILWSLDSRLAENNRDRAQIEKSILKQDASIIENRNLVQSNSSTNSITQSQNDLDP